MFDTNTGERHLRELTGQKLSELTGQESEWTTNINTKMKQITVISSRVRLSISKNISWQKKNDQIRDKLFSKTLGNYLFHPEFA
jgi:hypothetical protein